MSKKTTKTTTEVSTNKTDVTIADTLTLRETAQAKITSLITEINTIIDRGENGKTDEQRIELANELETLNAEIKAEEFTNILGCELPALEACRRGFINLATIKTDPTTKKVEQKSKEEIIDLAEVQIQDTAKQITVDPMWAIFSEALNHAILNYNMEVQGITEKSKRLTKFKISTMAKMLNITESEMATTDGIKNAMQKVVNSILKDYKVTDKNAMQFLLNYTKYGKAINGVVMPTEGTFRRLLMRILYQIVNNATLIAE